MGMETKNNFAFIDNQNLYCAMRDIGWDFDYNKFRRYLKDKFNITQAFIFIGYKVTNQILYTQFERMGYVVIFKPTLISKDGIIKGNCDAELVLHTMVHINNFDKAIIVSGDGDFHCLVEYLIKKNKLLKLMIPRKDKYSALLRKFIKYIFFINHQNLKYKLTKNSK